MANNISIKLDLQKIPGAAILPLGKDNTECICIPIEFANLYKGTKGIYLDLTAIPLTQPKADSKDTHLVKQSFGKDKFAAMTEEQKKAIPILGNMIVWGESVQQQQPAPAAANNSTPSWL